MNGSVTLHNSERNETDSFRKFIPCIKLPFVSSIISLKALLEFGQSIECIEERSDTRYIDHYKSLDFSSKTATVTDRRSDGAKRNCRFETWLSESNSKKKKKKKNALQEISKLIFRIRVDREIAICNVNTETLGTIHTGTHRSKTTPR